MVTARLVTESADVTLQADYWPLGQIMVVWLEGQWAGLFSRVAAPTPQALRDARLLHALTEHEAAVVADCAVLLWEKLELLDRLVERIAEALLFPVLMKPVRSDAIAQLAVRLEVAPSDVELAMRVLDFQRRIKISTHEGELYWSCDMPPALGSGAYAALLHARAA